MTRLDNDHIRSDKDTYLENRRWMESSRFRIETFIIANHASLWIAFMFPINTD